MRVKTPYLFRHEVGPICRAGQHENCPAVGDPYDDEITFETRDLWVCACACHATKR